MRKTIMTLAAMAAMGAVGCRPSDILSVPAPDGVSASGAVQNQSGAEALFITARSATFGGLDGVTSSGILAWSELLTDEFTWADFSYPASSYDNANIDARWTAALNGYNGATDYGWQNTLTGRSSLLLSIPLLRKYEPAALRSRIGEAYALVGYAELVIAEDFCSGTTLSTVALDGGYQFGTPLTTDSLFGVAELAFDSAFAHANGSDTIRNLARVGLGRALLDRGRYDSAASVLASVPTGFVYNTDLQPYASGSSTTPNMYSFLFQYRSYTLLSVSDREGQTGLNFRSARDPRVPIDSTLGPTSDGGTWYFPAKFEGPGLEYIPLASGVEARLVQAEAALHDGQVGTWASDLNALRATLGIASLPADSTTAASAAMQVDVMFRERAFWLFGIGTRLGDLRRLIRQYGRDQSTVFPTGPYPGGNSPNLPSALPSYGTDVSLTLPGPTSAFPVTNPNYKGCLDHNA